MPPVSTDVVWNSRSYTYSDPTGMTVAWPSGAGCAVFAVEDVGFVDPGDTKAHGSTKPTWTES